MGCRLAGRASGQGCGWGNGCVCDEQQTIVNIPGISDDFVSLALGEAIISRGFKLCNSHKS